MLDQFQVSPCGRCRSAEPTAGRCLVSDGECAGTIRQDMSHSRIQRRRDSLRGASSPAEVAIEFFTHWSGNVSENNTIEGAAS